MRVPRSFVSAITHTPASGPDGPVTTPPMSSASIATVTCALRWAGANANAAASPATATPRYHSLAILIGCSVFGFLALNSIFRGSRALPHTAEPQHEAGPALWAGPAVMHQFMAAVCGSMASRSVYLDQVQFLVAFTSPALFGQRVRAELEVHGHRLHALTAFHLPRRAVARGRPQAAAFPAGARVIDAAVEPFGEEAHRIGHAQRHHLAVLAERHKAIGQVGGRHRHVLAHAERVVLVDPRVVARLRAVIADARKARARVFVERPAFRTVVAGRGRTVERALALGAVEAADMAGAKRHPVHAVRIYVAAAWTEARQRDIVDFGECRLGRVRARIDAHDRAGIGADRAPDRAVLLVNRHGIDHLAETHVLARLLRAAGLGVFAALAVAAGIDDQRGPASRLRRVVGLIPLLDVEPTDYAAAATRGGPQRVVAVVGEVQMVGREADIDEVVFLRLGIVDRELATAAVERVKLGRRVVPIVAVGGLFLLVTERGRHPDPALLVEHRVVVVEVGFPDLLVAPVGRRAEWLFHGRMAGTEILVHVRVADRRLVQGRSVGLRIDDRHVAHAVFGLAIDRTAGIDGRVTPIGGDEVMQVVLLIRPVPSRDHDVAFEARRTLRLGRRQLALRDPVRPIRQVWDRRSAKLI